MPKRSRSHEETKIWCRTKPTGDQHGIMYNAAGQNNRSWRYSYNTDTGYEGGASMQPTGVPGRSSGHSYWRD